MSAAAPLAALLDDLDESRARIRADRAHADFQALLQQGIRAWEQVVATVDAGGSAEAALPTVVDLFTLDEGTREDTRTAEEMLRLGVGTPEHHFLAGLVPVRRALVKANEPVVAMLRRAAALERRGRSRWRSADGKVDALVERDLKLEEVRVAVKELLAEVRAVSEVLRRRLRP